MDRAAMLKSREQSNDAHFRRPGVDQTAGPCMESLLPVQTTDGVNTVNARSLHAVLGVGRDYSTWFKGRVAQYKFAEGVDFTALPQSGEPANNGFQTAIEHHISLDMAKELAMVENNVAGRTARRYFIAAEKRLREVVELPQTYLEALEAHVISERKRLALEAEAKPLRLKAAFTDAVISTADTMDMATAAQKLDMGRNRLFSQLRHHRVLIGKGERWNLPYQTHIDAGHFVVRAGIHDRPDGPHNHSSLRVTPKGLVYLHGLLIGAKA